MEEMEGKGKWGGGERVGERERPRDPPPVG